MIIVAPKDDHNHLLENAEWHIWKEQQEDQKKCTSLPVPTGEDEITVDAEGSGTRDQDIKENA